MTFEPLSSSLTGNAAFMVEKDGTFVNQQRHRTLLASYLAMKPIWKHDDGETLNTNYPSEMRDSKYKHTYIWVLPVRKIEPCLKPGKKKERKNERGV